MKTHTHIKSLETLIAPTGHEDTSDGSVLLQTATADRRDESNDSTLSAAHLTFRRIALSMGLPLCTGCQTQN